MRHQRGSWSFRPALRLVGASAGRSHLAIAKSVIKRDEIASRQLHALREYQGPREKKLRVHDVKEMFEQMKDQA